MFAPTVTELSMNAFRTEKLVQCPLALCDEFSSDVCRDAMRKAAVAIIVLCYRYVGVEEFLPAATLSRSLFYGNKK